MEPDPPRGVGTVFGGKKKHAEAVAAAQAATDVELRLLRRSHIESWVKQMTAAGLAPGTVHTRVQNVRAVLKGAVRDRGIATDPSDGVTLPRRRRREHAMSISTPPQVGALLTAAGDRFAAFIAICAFGGLRLEAADERRTGAIAHQGVVKVA